MTNEYLHLTNKALRYILAVYKHQNITKAAESLYISQPALTHYIHTLEKNIGCSLFAKSRSGMIPTYMGGRVIEYAKQILLLEDEMIKEMLEVTSADIGELRFALPLLREANILPIIVPPFKERYPKVVLRISEAHASHLLPLLTNGTSDIALLNFIPSDEPFIEYSVIRSEQLLVALPPNHPIALQKNAIPSASPYHTIDLRELKDESFILQNKDQRTRQLSDILFNKLNIQPKIYLETRSIEASLRLTTLGCGVCFASETHITTIPMLQKPALFYVDDPNATVYLVLAYLQSRFQPRYFQDFMAIIRERLSQRPLP